MDFGSYIYFRFATPQPLSCVFNTIFEVVSSEGAILPIRQANGSAPLITCNPDDEDQQQFASVAEATPAFTRCRSVRMDCTTPDLRRQYVFAVENVENGAAKVLSAFISSDLWVPFLKLKMDRGKSDGRYSDAINCSIVDYKLLKRLFLRFNAESCLGSCFNNFREIDDPGADEAFAFTLDGPQKLIRPLEEERDFVYGEESDFSTDPDTGLPRWRLIVDKPFNEILT